MGESVSPPQPVDARQCPQDAVNLSCRPSVGAGELVFDVALRRWQDHAAGGDGRCTRPGCGAVWPCSPAGEARRVMDGCLSFWARLDCHDQPPHAAPQAAILAVEGGAATAGVGGAAAMWPAVPAACGVLYGLARPAGARWRGGGQRTRSTWWMPWAVAALGGAAVGVAAAAVISVLGVTVAMPGAGVWLRGLLVAQGIHLGGCAGVCRGRMLINQCRRQPGTTPADGP